MKLVNWMSIAFGTLVGIKHVYSNTMTDFCGGYSASDFVSDLVMDHNEFVITNAQFTGNCESGGKIDFSGSTHYVEQEICGSSLVLTSGRLATAIVTSNSAESVSSNNGEPGDADLDALTSDVDVTYDAAVIDFDVTSTAQNDVQVTFKYVFASEEYNEYAPSIFNDVFAFFVDGVNVAQVLVDGTDDEYVDVSINNINLNSNNQYYINNDLNSGAFYNTEYDGLTYLLETIPFVLSPGITVHVKLAIADRTDYVWDSTVYLQAASFVEFSACPYDFQQCASSPCDCNEINNCQNCNNGQCQQCAQGYFRLTYNHQCLDCGSLFTGCLHCQDFQGCAQCDNGYERVYNDDCGVYECVAQNNDCPRYRRPWHLLTDNEKNLYIDGFLYLHSNGLIPNQLATIHTAAWNPAHGGSGFFPWHRYFLYELETQIRNIGGPFACFGLPYWDWGHDSLAAFTSDLFTSGLSNGGPGCVTGGNFQYPNYYTSSSTQCLTRFSATAALTFTPSATLVQDMLNNVEFGTNTGFRSRFESYHNTPHVVIGGNMGGGGSPYDPIFYLHHCYVDFLWAVWQDCHDYDEVDKNDLDCKVNIYDEYDNNGVSVDVGLDDPLDFNDLHNQAWSVVNDYNPTHRDMHDITEWNIIYDKGDFWDEGLVEDASNCADRMNDEWFIGSTRRRNMQENDESCSLNLQECDDNPLINVCDCDELVPNTCNVCHENQGCAECASGYFKTSFNHKCVNCESLFDGMCSHCQDFNGCAQCNEPYERVYDANCGIFVCQDEYDPNATPAPTITNVIDVIANDWQEILDTQTGLTMPEKRELLKSAVCEINKQFNIDQGNVVECIVPDDFEDCSDMVIADGQFDIDITLAELLNKGGVVDTPCLQDIRTAMYPWVSTTGGLLDLCNGFYDPQC